MALDTSSILLTDRVALVTGAGSGIGRGIARGFTAFGARVAIWERDPDSAQPVAEEIGALGLVTDVRESADVDAALARTTESSSVLSTILVNNAGGVFKSPPARDDRERLGRARPAEPAPRDPLHPADRPSARHEPARPGSITASATSIEGVRLPRVSPPTPRPRRGSSTTPRRPHSSWPPTASGPTRAGARHHR